MFQGAFHQRNAFGNLHGALCSVVFDVVYLNHALCVAPGLVVMAVPTANLIAGHRFKDF